MIIHRYFPLILALIIVLNSCDENEYPNCGCNSEIEYSIIDEENRTGNLYLNTEKENDNAPDYQFGIWYSEPNCSNCLHYFFICNDEFLDEFGVISPYPGIEVTFSGEIMNLCNDPISPADYTYNYILLTKIERL